jgi:Right handed beta helix region
MVKMFNRTLSTLFIVTTLLILCPLRGEAQQAFYFVSSLDDQLRIIDATTAVTVSSVTISLSGKVVKWANGLAKHPQTGQLFALLTLSSLECDIGPCARELVTIDPATGTATDVGNTGDAFAGLAFSSAGTLYGVTGDGAVAPETLYTLNTANAAKTLVGTLGNGDSGEAIAFNPDNGLIYHASGRKTRIFETINPSTLSITNVPLSGVVYLEGAALTYWQSQGVFLMIDTPPGFPPNLLRITPSGVVSCVGGVDHVDANGIVSCVGAVDHYGKGLAPTGPGATTFHVDCSLMSLEAAINAAQSGDTILVTGTCRENVLVRNDRVRVFLNGGGTAIISGSDPTRPTLDVRGKAISIQGFTITGGSSGIEVQRGANAVIDNNIIDSVGGPGVVVNQLAFAVMTHNTIRNNQGDGIVVKEGAAARIGFNSGNELLPSGNTIQMNSGNGITVASSSSARMTGNAINSNGDHGVEVMSGAQADISNNSINSNGGDGIFVTQDSAAQLGEDPGLFAAANSGTGNGGFGINCDFGGALEGLIGSLTGNTGATSLDASCPNSLSP